MKKFIPVFVVLLIISSSASAQFSRYIIRLKDKGSNPFTLSNPSQYLTQRAILRRQRYNIALDSTDLPVTPRYIDSIRLAGNVEILNSSKWLNQVAIRTTDMAALAKINSFPFVIATNPIAAKNEPGFVSKNKFQTETTEISRETNTTAINYGISNGQVKIHKTDWLHNRGFRGEGMQMAVLDAGFYHYQTLPTFDSIRLNNQILGTWDFVAKEASVNEDDSHGMQCLSTIGANLPGTFVGTAPKASFYLYRTEDVASEYPIEEQNWVAGIERADSLGIDISSTSLGYYDFDNSIFNHTYADMDGNTTLIARGADLAAKKGILCVIAAGNEGNSAWHYIITPADADSVLSVGAVDTLGNVASFSSYGPSSDGQIKPAVASVGLRAVVANPSTGQPSFSNGTSFACPNMAGATTCLWQAFPEVNNMGIIYTLEKSATKFNNPDTRVGYGIPDLKKAFVLLEQQLVTKSFSVSLCNATIQFSAKTTDDMKVELERRSPGQPTYQLVHTVQGQGAFALRNYTFNDNLAGQPTGNINYRLKMTIAADTSFYLDSLVINHAEICAPKSDSIFIGPNPAKNYLYVNIQRAAASQMKILLINSAGQQLYTKEFAQSIGVSQQIIPMQGRAAGVYFIIVYADGKKLVTKKIVH